MDEKSRSTLKQIRTFQGDVAEALEKENASLVSIQRKEEVKREKTGAPAPVNPLDEEKKKNLLLLFVGSIFLIGCGGLAAWYSYDQYVKRTQPPVISTPENRFIAAETSINIDTTSLTRSTFISLIADKAQGVGQSEVRHFVLRNGSSSVSQIASTSLFFKIMEADAPSSLVRALDKDFMLGTLGTSHFLIFKVNSYENAFPGMLEWEKTMADDIGPLFATYDLLKATGDPSVFKDVASRNKDARVLFSIGESGQTPVLVYSFFDNRMLIITDSLESLKTLIDRLTAELLSR